MGCGSSTPDPAAEGWARPTRELLSEISPLQRTSRQKVAEWACGAPADISTTDAVVVGRNHTETSYESSDSSSSIPATPRYERSVSVSAALNQSREVRADSTDDTFRRPSFGAGATAEGGGGFAALGPVAQIGFGINTPHGYRQPCSGISRNNSGGPVGEIVHTNPDGRPPLNGAVERMPNHQGNILPSPVLSSTSVLDIAKFVSFSPPRSDVGSNDGDNNVGETSGWQPTPPRSRVPRTGGSRNSGLSSSDEVPNRLQETDRSPPVGLLS